MTAVAGQPRFPAATRIVAPRRPVMGAGRPHRRLLVAPAAELVAGICGHTLTGLLRSVFTCNAGCGELYWGEWCYDPPDACDPCDCYGNYVGQGVCGPTCWQKFWAGVHGARNCPVGCSGGCSACCDTAPACGCDGGGAPELMDPEIISPGLEIYETQDPGIGADDTQSVLITAPRAAAAEPYYARHPQSRLARRPGR